MADQAFDQGRVLSDDFSQAGASILDRPPQPTPGATVEPFAPDRNEPSLSEAELASRVRILFQEARTARQQVVAQWNRNDKMMRNRTWHSARPQWLPSPEIPEIRRIVASCVAWVTDQRPKFDLTPAAEPYTSFYDFFDELAQDMKTALNSVWINYGWESEVEKVVWDAYRYSVGWFKVGWDASLSHGLGDVSLRRRDPRTIYTDPQGSSMSDISYIIEASRVSLQELDRRFPGAAAKFGLHGWIENTDEVSGFDGARPSPSFPRANPGAISPATIPRYGLPGQSRERAAASHENQGVTLLEAWLREHVVYEVDGTPKVYECWRCVCVAGPFVLMNKLATEVFPFERHPFIRYTPEDTGEFYGQSMVELLTPAQLAVNDILSSIQANIRLHGNPPFVEDTRTNLQRTKITGQPGERLTIAPGARADWMDPPQSNQVMPEMVKFYIGVMENDSGLSAIAQGIAPGGRTAADVLDSVQESGFVRIRMALRGLEWTLREVGQLSSAIIGEFYTEPRLASVVGPGQKVTKALKGRHFYLPTENGAIPMRFQVLVHAGSMLPTSRQAKIAEADTLYAMNAIDREAVLEAHDWPNRQIIAEKMAQLDASGMVQGPGARQAAGRLT